MCGNGHAGIRKTQPPPLSPSPSFSFFHPPPPDNPEHPLLRSKYEGDPLGNVSTATEVAADPPATALSACPHDLACTPDLPLATEVPREPPVDFIRRTNTAGVRQGGSSRVGQHDREQVQRRSRGECSRGACATGGHALTSRYPQALPSYGEDLDTTTLICMREINTHDRRMNDTPCRDIAAGVAAATPLGSPPSHEPLWPRALQKPVGLGLPGADCRCRRLTGDLLPLGDDREDNREKPSTRMQDELPTPPSRHVRARRRKSFLVA